MFNVITYPTTVYFTISQQQFFKKHIIYGWFISQPPPTVYILKSFAVDFYKYTKVWKRYPRIIIPHYSNMHVVIGM